MTSSDLEIMFHGDEDKEPKKVHDARGFEWPELMMATTDSLPHQN